MRAARHGRCSCRDPGAEEGLRRPVENPPEKVGTRFDGEVTGTRLAEWLGRMDDEAITALLDRRPDALVGRAPTTLGQLAERLSHPSSLAAALSGLTAPGLQAVEAL